ncbi:MAG: ATP-dependent zinc metalloprotease FtsH [Candidatus Levybacteria bacterium]|nr:ATP-dependent zinc metalloprotease FtsH [Candidatus Levybacteria bacterium]
MKHIKLPKGSKNKKKGFKLRLTWKDLILYSFIFLFFVFLSFGIGDLTSSQSSQAIPLTTALKDIKDKKVKDVSVSTTKLTLTYKDGKKATADKEQNASIYEVLKNSNIDPASVNITIKDTGSMGLWVNILTGVLPILLMVAFFFFIFRQARGAQENIFSFGSSKAKAFNKDFPKTTFDQVAGVNEAKQELSEIVDFLKHPEKYKAVGARAPKGVLLVGPSGTGKTLLARAVAGEAKVAFFSIAGSEFMEMLVGVGAARARDLFATAKKAQPAIIFIDEVDAIGRQRGTGMMGGHDEREQTLNQILVEMDGFAPTEQLVVMAATNRPDVLDPALVRPGRFDRRVVLPLPDIEGRKEILKIHSVGKPFEKSVNWEKIARRTVGFSGADLENMLNEAAILTARENRKTINEVDLEEAATKVKMGPEKKRFQSEEDKRITAYHESGHAIVSFSMPHMDPVHKISIVGRGMSLGHTLIPPALDRVHETQSRLLEQIATMLGGRTAEELIFGEITTGAADDIEKASMVARAMVVDYGMSGLGPISFDKEQARMYGEGFPISDTLQSKIDAEVTKIIDEAHKKATAILTKNRKKLDIVAKTLLTKETLEGEEFIRIMSEKTTAAKPSKA